MAPDDRDRTFEKALARHLRPSSSSTDANQRGAAPTESCPDPETLAAYHERSLSLHELSSWKQHIAGCERCQLVLTHLETTEDIPLGVDADENVVAMKAPVFAQSPVHASSAATRAASPALSPPRSVLDKAAAAPADAKRSTQRTQWRWLAPAGALAASLLVWIALHESQSRRLTTPPPVQDAQNREPSPLPPEPRQAAETDKDQRARFSERTAVPRADADKVIPQRRSQQLSRENSSTTTSSVELESRKKESEEKARSVVTADAQAADQSKAQADEFSSQRDNERQAAVHQNAPTSSQPAFVSGEASAAPAAPAPSTHARQSQTRVGSQSGAVGGAVSSSAETADNKISSNLQSMKPFHLAKTPSSRVVGAPGDKLLWLLGSNGLISVSSDNGTTWTQQSSGVTAELLAGSAPTEQVCWIVGSSGTILRTTDGGAHWFKQTSPLTSDLFSIRATDALHAQIWSTPDPQSHSVRSYQTNDGGVTWTQVPNP